MDWRWNVKVGLGGLIHRLHTEVTYVMVTVYGVSERGLDPKTTLRAKIGKRTPGRAVARSRILEPLYVKRVDAGTSKTRRWISAAPLGATTVSPAGTQGLSGVENNVVVSIPSQTGPEPGGWCTATDRWPVYVVSVEVGVFEGNGRDAHMRLGPVVMPLPGWSVAEGSTSDGGRLRYAATTRVPFSVETQLGITYLGSGQWGGDELARLLGASSSRWPTTFNTRAVSFLADIDRLSAAYTATLRTNLGAALASADSKIGPGVRLKHRSLVWHGAEMHIGGARSGRGHMSEGSLPVGARARHLCPIDFAMGPRAPFRPLVRIMTEFGTSVLVRVMAVSGVGASVLECLRSRFPKRGTPTPEAVAMATMWALYSATCIPYRRDWGPQERGDVERFDARALVTRCCDCEDKAIHMACCLATARSMRHESELLGAIADVLDFYKLAVANVVVPNSGQRPPDAQPIGHYAYQPRGPLRASHMGHTVVVGIPIGAWIDAVGYGTTDRHSPAQGFVLDGVNTTLPQPSYWTHKTEGGRALSSVPVRPVTQPLAPFGGHPWRTLQSRWDDYYLATTQLFPIDDEGGVYLPHLGMESGGVPGLACLLGSKTAPPRFRATYVVNSNRMHSRMATWILARLSGLVSPSVSDSVLDTQPSPEEVVTGAMHGDAQLVGISPTADGQPFGSQDTVFIGMVIPGTELDPLAAAGDVMVTTGVQNRLRWAAIATEPGTSMDSLASILLQ